MSAAKSILLRMFILVVIGMLGCGTEPKTIVPEQQHPASTPEQKERQQAIGEIEKLGGEVVAS